MKRFLYGMAGFILLTGLFCQMKPAEKDFEGFFTYELKVFNVDESESQSENTVNMTFYIKDHRTLIDLKNMGSQGMKILIDRDEDVIYQLMEANGQKMAMKMDLDQLRDLNQEGDEEKEEKSLKTKSTGKTKSILGYKCSQRTVESEDVSGHVWVTKEVDVNLGKIFEVLNKHPRNKFGKRKVRSAYSYPFKGFVMESMMKDKNEEQTKIKTKVTELKAKSLQDSRFDVSGYQVMDMNGGMTPNDR